MLYEVITDRAGERDRRSRADERWDPRRATDPAGPSPALPRVRDARVRTRGGRRNADADGRAGTELLDAVRPLPAAGHPGSGGQAAHRSGHGGLSQPLTGYPVHTDVQLLPRITSYNVCYTKLLRLEEVPSR